MHLIGFVCFTLSHSFHIMATSNGKDLLPRLLQNRISKMAWITVCGNEIGMGFAKNSISTPPCNFFMTKLHRRFVQQSAFTL